MQTSRRTSRKLSGSMTALVTPFRDGEVDWQAFRTLVERQAEGGTDWVVPCGTTGETPTLSSDERARLLEETIEGSAGRCGVMAGTGSYCTASTVEMTKAAAGAGAQAALIVTPYYNRPTQEGMFRHFAAVAEAVDLPIVLYNVPVRTGVNLSNDTIVRLRERFPHIAGLKDASGSVDGVTDLLQRSDITVLSGDDVLTWPMMSLGAAGVISVLANLAPGLMKALVTAADNDERATHGDDAAARSDRTAALAYHRKVSSLANGLGRFGPNPVPIKTAMAIAGLIAEEFRLPLCGVDEESRRSIERLIRRHELLEPVVAQ